MAFGAVVCSACRRAQVFDLRHRSNGCRSCGQRIDAQQARFFYRGHDADEARRVVQRVSAQLAGMGVEDLARLVEAQQAERVGSIQDLLATALMDSEFTPEEFAQEVARQRVPGNPDRVLDRLVAENRVYEPRPGRFRVL